MKKKMKKLWAVLMAVAMVLSLASTALATDPDPNPDAPTPYQPYAGSTDKSTLSGDAFFGDTGDSTEGHSTSEGPEPDDPIELILPTVSQPEDGKMNVFDMILDPHNMILKTKGARYDVDGEVKKTFADGLEAADADADASADNGDTTRTDYSTAPRLYFATTISGDSEYYSGTSQELKIINKGRQEVNVDLSLDFTKYPSALTMVGSKEDLANAPTGLNDAGAQMYLALVQGEETKAVSTLSGDELPVITVDGRGDYLAGTLATFEWGENVDKAIKDDVGNLTFTVSYTAPASASTREPTAEEISASNGELTADSLIPVDATPATISISGEWADTAYVVEGGSVTEDDTFTDGVATVTATVKESDDASAATLATVEFKVQKPNYRTMDEEENQSVSFKAPADGAMIRTAIAAKADAYDYAVWDGTGDKPQGTTDKGYYWKPDTSLTNDDYPYIKFKLVGDINNDLAWDGLYEDGDISFTLIWDVLQRNTYNKALVDTAVNENIGEPALLTPSNGTAPRFTVTTKATTSKQLVLTISAGSEDYAGYTPKIDAGTTNTVTMSLSNGNSLTTSYASNKLTATGTASTNYNTTIAATSTTGTVVFEKEGYEDIEVTTPTGLR